MRKPAGQSVYLVGMGQDSGFKSGTLEFTVGVRSQGLGHRAQGLGPKGFGLRAEGSRFTI